MPSTIQYALAVESFFNILSATAFLLYPSTCLSYALPTTLITGTTIIPASTTTLLQVFGAMVFCITVPLLLALPEGPHAVTARKGAYYTLGAGEAFLIPLLLSKAAGGEASGFGSVFMVASAATLAPILGWRIHCLFVKPILLEPSAVVTMDGKKRH